MRRFRSKTLGDCSVHEPIPFAGHATAERPSTEGSSSQTAERAIAAVETMSRKLEDLARELNCFGYFDGDDDRPRAA
ncbi:MAG: hypothetical protein ACYTJ0_11280 [Planctomycetota bacterium]|jgi:hypothetical protein